MDLITQGLLGSTVAQAVYSKKLGRRAALYGFLAGLVPDFDIIAGLWGPWASLKYHRGPTHSFIILAALALPVGWLCKKLARSEADLSNWVGLAALSLLTHPVIDWFTSYGTCLLWPLTDRRFAIDALPIIEPVYSIPLLLVTICGLTGLCKPERSKLLAIGALIFTTFYAGWGYNNSQNLIHEGTRLFQARGFEPVEVRATPTLLNLLVFRVCARDLNNRFMVTYLRKDRQQPLSDIVTLNSADDEFVRKALADYRGNLFKWFTMNMLYAESLTQPDGGHKVYLHDMRYGMLLAPGLSLFSAEADFDKQGNLTSFSRRQNHGSVNFKEELKATMAHAFASNPDIARPPLAID